MTNLQLIPNQSKYSIKEFFLNPSIVEDLNDEQIRQLARIMGSETDLVEQCACDMIRIRQMYQNKQKKIKTMWRIASYTSILAMVIPIIILKTQFIFPIPLPTDISFFPFAVAGIVSLLGLYAKYTLQYQMREKVNKMCHYCFVTKP